MTQQIDLLDLIQDHDAGIAAKMDAGDILAVVADLPAPPKPQRKRLVLNAAQSAPAATICGIAAPLKPWSFDEPAKPKRARKAKAAPVLASPPKVPRRPMRPTKSEKPTARVKRDRAAKPKGPGQ